MSDFEIIVLTYIAASIPAYLLLWYEVHKRK